MKIRQIVKKAWRLTLFGILASYAYTIYYFASHLLFRDGNIVWGVLGNGTHQTILFFIGVLFFFPIIGAAASFITGLATTLVTENIERLNEKWRERIGLIAVALVTTGVLGLPAPFELLFGYLRTLLSFFVGLLIGAVLVFGAIKLPRIELWARRIAGGLLGLATLLFFFFYFFALGDFPFTEQPESSPGPNILIILSDTHRADIASTFGGEVPTPNLDRLAARGVRFDRCYSTSNWTIPAVASIFTGTSHALHGVDGFRPLSDSLPTLQGLLGREGYRSWGLFCSTAISSSFNFYSGFDTYANYDVFRTSAFGVPFAMLVPLYASFSSHLSISLLRADVQRIKSIVPKLTVELSSKLEAEGGIYAYIHLFDPHLPYVPPDEFVPEGVYDGPMGRWLGFDFAGKIKQEGPDAIRGDDRRGVIELYKGEIRYEDEIIGRILDNLEKTGAIDNTAIFFVADHGEELWDHGDWDHGLYMYDEVVRVPLIASWPGVLPEGEVRTDRVSIADIFPTVLDALDIEYDSKPIIGRSLLLPPDPERVIFAERSNDQNIVRLNRPFHQIVVHASAGSLILDRDTGDVSYFLPDDLTQQHELGYKYPERRDYLLGLIEEYDAEQAALRETYNPLASSLSAEAAAAQLENLRAIGYLQ